MRIGKVYVGGGFVLCFSALYFMESLRFVLILLAAAAAHELGHLIAIRLTGGHLRQIRLECTGACIFFDASRVSYLREIICALSGPAASLLLAFAVSGLGLNLLVGVSVLLGLFNLLPAPVLDGGRALAALLGHFTGPGVSDRVLFVTGCLTIAALFAGSIWIYLRGGLFLLPLACGILLAASVAVPRARV